MRPILFILFLFFSSAVFSETNCQYGNVTNLAETWKLFRQVSLDGTPQKISSFYKFPLFLLGPYDGDKPIVISKKVFLQDYQFIFRQIVDETDTNLFSELKKTKENEYIPMNGFDRNGCNLSAKNQTRISDYVFIWNKRNGWLVKAVYVGVDYSLLNP
jgi:hypothetical protein